jgi:ferredoxin
MEYRGERPRATVVDIDRCKGCGKCVKICPAGAIELVVVKNGKP